MPDPTTNPNTPDYSNLKSPELRALLEERDAALLAARDRLRDFEAQATIDAARAEELAQKRAARGTPKLLGKVDVFDTDEPEDVLERAKAVRAGKVPVAVAKVFRTDAMIRAPAGSALAGRLGAKKDAPAPVPLGTEFKRGEVPDASIDAWYAAAAIIPIG